MAQGAPEGHSHQNVDHIASRLLQTSKNADVRSAAGAALSVTRTTPKGHTPVAHTSAKVAATAVRSVAASVLSDRQTKKR